MKNPMNVRERITRSYFPEVLLPPVVDDNVKRVPQPVYGVRLEHRKGKSAILQWDTVPENKEKEAVRFLVQQFGPGSGETNGSGGQVILTGQKHLELSKKDLKEIKTVVIRAVSRNNDVSDPVTFQL
jgi:hypothetical protein